MTNIQIQQDDTVQMPLQTGGTAALGIMRFAVPAAIGVGLTAVAFTPFRPLSVLLLLLSILPWSVAIAHVLRSLRTLPSDVLLSNQGIRIDDGTHVPKDPLFDDNYIDWKQIRRGKAEVVVANEPCLTMRNAAFVVASALSHNEENEYEGPVLDVHAHAFEAGQEELFRVEMRDDELHQPIGRLMIPMVSGDIRNLGRAETPLEFQTLASVGEVINATDNTIAKSDCDRDHLLYCLNCDAVVSPVPREQTTCAYCGEVVLIDKAVAKQCKAALLVQDKLAVFETRLKEVIACEDAGAARKRVQQGLMGSALVFLVCLIVYAVFARGMAWPVLLAILLGVPALSGISSIYYAVRKYLVDRTVLQILATSFAACQTESNKTIHNCRNCGAPLDSEKRRLVVCTYCNAQNLLAFERPLLLTHRKNDSQSIEIVFKHRDQVAASFNKWFVVYVTAAFLSIFLIVLACTVLVY